MATFAGVVVVLLLIGAVVYLPWKAWADTSDPTQPAQRHLPVLESLSGSVLPVRTEVFVQSVQVALAGMRNVAVTSERNTVTVACSYVPFWAGLVAVLLFPIGLLALLAKVTEVGVVALTELPDGCSVTISGNFEPEARTALCRLIVDTKAAGPGLAAARPAEVTSSSAASVATTPPAVQPTLPPAGWFRDPAGSGARRWWDGTAWTEHLNDSA